MPNYKDSNNNLHFLDNPEDANKYLPDGCVEITDAEAEAIRQAAITPLNPNDIIVAQIAALEAAAMIPRVAREFMLGIALKEALAAGYTEAQFIAVNIGYAKVKAQDEQIKALRARLT